MKTAGLKKTSEFKEFKVWVFEWKKWHKGAAAEKLCKSLSGLSSLDYCEPDYTLIPARGKKKKESSAGTRAGTRTGTYGSTGYQLWITG